MDGDDIGWLFIWNDLESAMHGNTDRDSVQPGSSNTCRGRDIIYYYVRQVGF